MIILNIPNIIILYLINKNIFLCPTRFLFFRASLEIKWDELMMINYWNHLPQRCISTKYRVDWNRLRFLCLWARITTFVGIKLQTCFRKMLKDNIVHHKQNVEHWENSNKYTQQVRRWDTCKHLKLKLIDIRYRYI